MGENGETCAVVASDSIEDGKSTEDYPHGKIAGSDSKHWRREHVGRFEVIEIMDDSNLYPMLLGIDWAINMNGVINLKKQMMSFERKSLRVVVPLDPTEGLRYTKPVRNYEKSDDDLDQIYKITLRDQDWVNSTTDGRITCDRKSSYTSDSDEELEH